MYICAIQDMSAISSCCHDAASCVSSIAVCLLCINLPCLETSDADATQEPFTFKLYSRRACAHLSVQDSLMPAVVESVFKAIISMKLRTLQNSSKTSYGTMDDPR
ncbi:TPA: hypothetical protein ACH3X2_007955 [Trebouxia sp. C0005]